MLRIKGRVGDWPVDLTVELDADDWAQLAAHLPPVIPVESTPSVTVARSTNAQADGLWSQALEVLQRAGSLEGPQLLAELAALTGGEVAGKRLLVRLRHCPQVQVESGGEAPLYRWIG